MTNKEILQKAMEKYYFNAKEIIIIEGVNVTRVDVYPIGLDYPSISVPYQCIIFSHDFAKAFWGVSENKVYKGYDDKGCYMQHEWEYHLQQMVLEEEPLKYLEKFL